MQVFVIIRKYLSFSIPISYITSMKLQHSHLQKNIQKLKCKSVSRGMNICHFPKALQQSFHIFYKKLIKVRDKALFILWHMSCIWIATYLNMKLTSWFETRLVSTQDTLGGGPPVVSQYNVMLFPSTTVML